MEIDPELVRSVKGFLDEAEGRCLYEFALQGSRRGPCLEIGSYCGKSTLYLGLACQKNNSILYAIDHHRGSEEQQPGQEYFDPDLFDPQTGRVDTFKEFRKTIERAGIEDAVVPMVCRSEVAAHRWATPLSLVFIDGGHSYRSALTDCEAWSGHILSGGYLIFHDIFQDPQKGGLAPYRVYMRAIASGLFRELTRVKSLGVLQRIS
ncbi:MAG: class I SAM-dependent methyltransferase [Desulfobacterales bacterium]|nr:MAG: class I SAM-dependent methyltransferase [Desulfobacterales bacterium]